MTQPSYRIAMIPGDGIGKEVVPAAQRVLAALPLTITFVPLQAGWEIFEQTGTALPQSTAAAIRAAATAPSLAPRSRPAARSKATTARSWRCASSLDLYANLRPIASMPVPGSQPGIDMLIVRENTECLYVRQERLEDDGNTAVAQRVITRRASERIARKAFEHGARATQPAIPRRTPVPLCDHRPQGQRALADRRPLPRVVPGGGRRNIRT